MKKNVFFISILWKSSPLSMVLNVIQYIIAGVSGSLLLYFSGQIVNALNADIINKKACFVLVMMISICTYINVIFQRFSQNIREKHIFAVQNYIDRNICLKMIDIPCDVQDSKSFQDDFSEIRQTNSKLYLYVTYLMQLIGVIVQLISAVVLIAKLSIGATVFYFIVSAIFISCVCKMQFLYWSEYLSQAALRRKKDYFLEIFTNTSVLSIFKAFNNGEFFLDKARQAVKETNEEADKVVFGENKKYYILQLLMLLIPISIMLMALYAYLQRKILVGEVIMYIGIGKQIHSVGISMGVIVQKFQKTYLSLDKLYDFIQRSDSNTKQNELYKNEKSKKPWINISNLTYTYPNCNTPTLKDISLTIEPGQKIAIVGKNGAGKTTLVKIILGLYRNYKGEVIINGLNTKFLSQRKISECIAPCFQDFLKPNFKLRESVAFSKAENIDNDVEILNYLELVHFDILEKSILEQQLGTMFKGGIDLSIGNWQKIAMARTIFTKNAVIVLDEPLASVDLLTEYQFLNFLNNRSNNEGITIVVSHRMLGMNLFDSIIFLDEGRIIEKGTHQELLSLSGKYRQLYEAQQL